jgi:hypothetical protein
MAWKRLLAPVPWGFITLAAPQTTTTSSKARPAAGTAIPLRRNSPRFFRELLVPNEPVPVALARVLARSRSVPDEPVP